MSEPKRQSKLAGLLAEMRITYTALARAAGITRRSMYNKIEGRVQFTYPEVVRICDLLNIENPRDYFII